MREVYPFGYTLTRGPTGTESYDVFRVKDTLSPYFALAQSSPHATLASSGTESSMTR